MKRKRKFWKKVYVIYLAALAATVTGCLVYVRTLLSKFENFQPEQYVRTAVQKLAEETTEEGFLKKYALEEPVPGELEENRNILKVYGELLAGEELELSQAAEGQAADELLYVVKKDGRELARVRLRAVSQPVTRLVVFTYREWQVEAVTPVLEKQNYELLVPEDFRVSVNGRELDAAEGTIRGRNGICYTIEGLYLPPELEIVDYAGRSAAYAVKDSEILAEYYDYQLTLPEGLTVQVDGGDHGEEAAGAGLVCHRIRGLTPPEVTLSDRYGNTFLYEGKELPLTYRILTVPEDFEVAVEGQTVSAEAAEIQEHGEYSQFAEYVQGLPRDFVYHIAILKEDAQVSVTDQNGYPAALEAGEEEHTFAAALPALEEVPKEVADQVDVLEVAQSWSLFLSQDYPFSRLERYLIEDSYQHRVAKSYATGVDITFTSAHVLRNPPFTEVSVGNFVWITQDCFSVDISFVKHLQLTSGKLVDDRMNDRFYFVRYDSGEGDAAWKMVGMKEIVSHGE